MQLGLQSLSLNSCTVHGYFEIHVNLTEPLKRRWTLLQRDGGVQTATQSRRLHSTAHECSTFKTAADAQEDTWLTIPPRPELSEEGNLYLALSRSD